MLVISGATARPTTVPQRCKPREPLPRNPAPRNPGPKKQNRLTAKPPLYLALMSPSSLVASKRRKSIGKRSKTGKTLLRPPETIPLRVRKATRSATIVRKSAILQETTRILKKTSISLGKLRAGD